LEGDLVSERLELGDEAFGGAFGVAAGEVVAAEVAVGPAVQPVLEIGDERGRVKRLADRRVVHGTVALEVGTSGGTKGCWDS
jgi:hypothetical protein